MFLKYRRFVCIYEELGELANRPGMIWSFSGGINSVLTRGENWDSKEVHTWGKELSKCVFFEV